MAPNSIADETYGLSLLLTEKLAQLYFASNDVFAACVTVFSPHKTRNIL